MFKRLPVWCLALLPAAATVGATASWPAAQELSQCAIADECKEVVTAGMDKSLALWRMDTPASSRSACNVARAVELTRLTAAGGPIFSLATPCDSSGVLPSAT